MPIMTLYEQLEEVAREHMQAINEEKNGFPKTKAKIEAFLAKMPEGKRDALREVLLPR